ncbi:MAG: DUF2130 domain-containing protein [Candidatus Peribacter sp.]|nr:DUF2130 domain-containing protein [Candidatus Peribacter sp.]
MTSKIRKELEGEMAVQEKQKEADLLAREKEIKRQEEEVEKQKKNTNDVVQEKLASERVKLKQEAEREAEKKVQLELKDAQSQNEEMAKKLEETQKNELELRRKTRELEEKEKNADLELERRLAEERNQVFTKAKQASDEEHRLKELESEKQMDGLKKTIDELQRKSEQGSMQIQGEVQEEDLKASLQRAFPTDTFTDVPTGVRGADLIQTVVARNGTIAGTILWESKNTKHWGGDWLQKLKDDQVAAKTDLCGLISQCLPEGLVNFGSMENVWVSDYKCARDVAAVLRHHLIELTKLKGVQVGRDEKMEVIYSYLTSPQFNNRMQSIVGAFQSMKTQLDKEKIAIQRIWAKREKEMDRMIGNTVGMYGDLQGLMGAALPTIASLELSDGEEASEEEVSDH